MVQLNGVFIIPTGLACSLGGDASYMPGVKLISNCTKNLIVNPNAVNASDINEIPSNALYVEGSCIDRFLEGKLNLKKIKTYNRIIVAVNSPASICDINAINAGIWGLGADIKLVELKTPVKMLAKLNPDGTAGGEYSGVDELAEQLAPYDYDALALLTPIDCEDDVSEYYWNRGGVNPWGGIEALVSKAVAEKINKPVAHGPSNETMTSEIVDKVIVKKTMAPEIISRTFMFCVFKGLHRAPKLEFDLTKTDGDTLSNDDIDFLISPHGCWGRPHQACVKKNIPIIIVKENTTCFSKNFHYTYTKNLIFVENYLEAAGLIMSMDCGVNYKNVLLSTL